MFLLFFVFLRPCACASTTRKHLVSYGRFRRKFVGISYFCQYSNETIVGYISSEKKFGFSNEFLTKFRRTTKINKNLKSVIYIYIFIYFIFFEITLSKIIKTLKRF